MHNPYRRLSEPCCVTDLLTRFTGVPQQFDRRPVSSHRAVRTWRCGATSHVCDPCTHALPMRSLTCALMHAAGRWGAGDEHAWTMRAQRGRAQPPWHGRGGRARGQAECDAARRLAGTVRDGDSPQLTKDTPPTRTRSNRILTPRRQQRRRRQHYNNHSHYNNPSQSD
jgi:hypothetical protein